MIILVLSYLFIGGKKLYFYWVLIFFRPKDHKNVLIEVGKKDNLRRFYWFVNKKQINKKDIVVLRYVLSHFATK